MALGPILTSRIARSVPWKRCFAPTTTTFHLSDPAMAANPTATSSSQERSKSAYWRYGGYAIKREIALDWLARVRDQKLDQLKYNDREYPITVLSNYFRGKIPWAILECGKRDEETWEREYAVIIVQQSEYYAYEGTGDSDAPQCSPHRHDDAAREFLIKQGIDPQAISFKTFIEHRDVLVKKKKQAV
ncbi:unnamed protein product [Cyclocybe aegerita]|uniref:Uncharacterized protein n=1 Tax=Cyclocybe aegerita TaxID=1973307 RepID=A0A8S0XTR7_CYCAE|nr:unnamed protein product [Cyclocybe aegerita]